MPFEPLATPSRFVPQTPYNYVEPDGDTEKLQFGNETVSAPAGTGRIFAEIENDDVFDAPSGVLEETSAVFEKQAAYVALVANAYGLVADDQINDFVAERSKALASAQQRQPEYMQEFQRQFDDAKGFFETAGVFLGNPRAIGRVAVTQSPNSILPLLTTFAGAKTGAIVGGAGGSVVPGVGTGAGAITGATVGGVTGAFPGGALVEIGAEIDGMMQESGVDITDANAVLRALQDDAFMDDIKTKAERKGITTAAVDSLFQVFGGRFIKAAKDSGKLTKAGAAVADVGVQSVGEGTSEAAGQFAKDGQVNFKEAALEAVSSIGQSVGQTAIGATVGQAREVAPDQVANSALDNIEDSIPPMTDDEINEILGLVPDNDIEVTAEQKRSVEAAVKRFQEKVPMRLEEIKAQLGEGFMPIPKKPETLSEFLIKRGGLKNDSEEARRFTKKESPNLKGVAKKTGQLDLDSAREAAVESGFLPEDANINDLLQALEYENTGADIVRDADLQQLEARDAIMAFNDDLDRIRSQKDSGRVIKNIRTAFTEGVRLARQDVKAAQEQVITALEKSGLSAKDRAKFIRSIKNIQTQEQLEKRSPALEKRIIALLEAEQARNLKSGINKALKTTKVKKQSGKPVGKFTADIQVRLDNLREIMKMSAGEASAILESRLSVENVPDVDQALENSALAIVAGDASIADMMKMLDQVKAIKAEGLAVADAKADARKARQAKMRENARTALDAGAGDPLMDSTKLRSILAKKARETVSQFTGMYSGWQDVLDIVFGSDKSGASEALMEDIGSSVSDAFQRSKGRARVASESAVKAIMEAFGFTNEKQLLRQLREDSKTVDLGIFTNERGEAVRLQLTKSEARKRWMEMQDPTLLETITSERGNAYTPDMIQTINNFLTFEDIAVAKAQLAFYRDFYQEVNAVYSEVYGVNLPFNEFYSPITRMHDKSTTTDDFMKEMGFRRSIAPGSLKSRTNNQQPLREQSDVRVLQKHILEMSHFMEFFPLIQDLNAVFGRGDIRQKIEDKWGRVMLQNIDSFIKDFTAGGVKSAETFDTIDKLRVNFTTSVLGLKPALAVKQMMSFPAYAENIPTKDFIAGLLDFAANPLNAHKTLMDSEMMKARGQNMERDIKDASRSQEFSAFRKTPNLKNMLLLAIRIGDRGAIVMGGWSVYKYHINQGASHQDALVQFDRATSLAQQSSDLDQLSRWQRGGSFAKLFTMFMSAPNQYLRREIGAIRKAARGNITKRELAKTLFIYHVLLPSMFQLASDLGRWDEENQIRAMVLGSFNGMFIIGDVIAAAIMAIQDESWYKTGTPIAEFIGDIMDGITDLAESDMDAEGFYEGVRRIGEGTGKLTGFPVEQGFIIGEGIADLSEGDTAMGVSKIMGWPPTIAEEFAESIE